MSTAQRITTLLAAAALAVAAAATPGWSTTTPTSLAFTAKAGGPATATQSVTVDLPREIPDADVLFLFDLTGSMGGQLATAKANATSIMADIGTVVDDVRFGVASHADYPGWYTSDGYSAPYGADGDYPYQLDLALTGDTTAVAGAIAGLPLLSGADAPESYTRALYETYTDELGWRDGARRIVIAIGDSVPHDLHLGEGTGLTWVLGNNTGVDPGRDAVAGTSDDLDLQSVLAEMRDQGVILFEVFSGDDVGFQLWQHWAGLTGGKAFRLGSTSALPATIVAAVESSAATVASLELVPTKHASWLSTTPSSFADVTTPATRVFDVAVTVPAGTAAGTYTLELDAVGDGASYGRVPVTITVVAMTMQGFSAPVDGQPALNVANAGQVVPLKWRLMDGDEPVLGLSPEQVTVRVVGLPSPIGTTADQAAEQTSGASGLQDLGDGYYQLNWKTPKAYAGSAKTVTVSVGGVALSADFLFTR